MNNALTTTGPGLSSADIFFDIPLVQTCWDEARTLIQDGVYNSTVAKEWIKEMEPLDEHDPRDHTHWVCQQILRLCLLAEAARPMESTHTCDECGQRPADALFGADGKWRRKCLNCAEKDRQTSYSGGRGSCEFALPRYNHRTHCWGILIYHSWNQEPIMFWLVDFFKNRHEAERALDPVRRYFDWLEVKYKGMCPSFKLGDMIHLDEMMQMKLPLTPEQFREILRSKIEKDMNEDQEVMGYYVRDAMREHDQKERDQ
jgi:hypothetical protein